MFESLVYVISMLLSLSSLCISHRTQKEESLIRSVILSYVTLQCITGVFAMVMDILNIPIRLYSISVLYLCVFLLFICYSIRTKKVQQLKIYSYDVYVFLILGIFFITLFILVFGTDIGIIYKNSDPGQHYIMALNTYHTGTVSRMYFSPLQNAIFMHMLDPFMLPISLYKAFILSDMVANFLTLSMMFILISTFVSNKFLKIATPVIILLWYMGWPFYSYIAGGYVYFGTGIMLFLYCIYWLIQLENSETTGEKIRGYILLGLGIYNISICYMLFMPIIGMIAIWYIGKEILKKRQLSKRTLLGILSLVLMIGGICFYVCFYGYFGGNLEAIFKGLQNEGGIHRELYKDIVLLLFPAVCVIAYYKKKDNILVHTAIVVLLTMMFAFTGVVLEIISGYYFYKLYYLLWTVLFLLSSMAVEIFFEYRKREIYAYFSVALCISMISLSHLDSYLLEHELSISDETAFIPIYGVNRWYIDTSEEPEDMASLRAVSMYINKNKEFQGKVKLFTSIEKYTYGVWFKAFCGEDSERINIEKESTVLSEVEKRLEEVKEEYSYFIMLKGAYVYRFLEEYLVRYNVVWEDDFITMYQF